jgi:hypothetical protein
MTQALKPCPFCGGNKITEIWHGQFDSSHGAMCQDCGATCSKLNWNTRPKPQVIYTSEYSEKVKEFITYKDYKKISKWCSGHRNGGTVTQYLLPCDICDNLKLAQGEK